MVKFKQLIGALTMLGAMGFGGIGNAAASVPCSGGVIKMIVPNPAGGTGDMIARILGDKAGAILGQPIVVENRAGATTTIGTASVAKSKPDGCTLLSLTASGVVASVLRGNLPYSLERDFVPLVGIGSFPMVLAVPAGSKLGSFRDLTTAAKAAEGIPFASGGTGSLAHLSAVRLLKDVGGTGTHVPFRGNADAIQALLGNQVQFFFPSSAEAIPLVQGNKIRVLGITSEKRLSSMPTVPTMKELGFADFNPRLWYAFLAPTGTPAETVTKLNEAFAKALADSSVQERLGALGFATDLQDSAEVTALMKSEAARWGKVIKDNNIKSSD